MLATFPHHRIPDGAVFGPHHFYLGVMLMLYVCWFVYDDHEGREPGIVVGLSLLAVFAFALTWPYYPTVGALGVLVTLGASTLAATIRPFWWRYGWRMRGSLAIGLVVAWDDAISHAFGWSTPLDTVWMEFIYPFLA